MSSKSADQKAKEEVLNVCHTLGKDPWFISKISNPPGFLYASFYLEGINIYKFSKGQVTLSQSYVWEDFTKATADFFAISTTLVLNGERNTTIVMMDSGKKLLPLLRSYTGIDVHVLDRPWWRKILGFRSNKKWKMVVAIVIYLVLASKVVGALNGNNVQTSSPTSANTSQTVSVDQAKAVADAKAKAEADAKAKAEAEVKAKEPISTDFTKFDTPYDNMTTLQKDAFWKTVENKYVQWTGEVVEVSKDSISVRIKKSTLTSDFLATINKDQYALLPKINLGQKVTIKGRLWSKEGALLPWALDDGQIIQ